MARTVARLKGSLLFVGGILWADDVDPDEAAEIIMEISNLPNAPTGVRIKHKVVYKSKK